jgi:predicted RNA-binding protein with PUA-like domain
MAWWLMKTEPAVFSLDDLERAGTAPWDGVRNYQARNHLRAMAVGDQVLIYHSNAQPSGLAGTATVVRAAYPDPTAWQAGHDHFDARSTPFRPLWDQVDVRFASRFRRFLPLPSLRADPRLTAMQLFRLARLSVQPVDDRHAAHLVRLGG